MFAWGRCASGRLANDSILNRSSPIQIIGTDWSEYAEGGNRQNSYSSGALKSDGSLWVWGYNYNGDFGQNGLIANEGRRSSPVQIPGTYKSASKGYGTFIASKTDGTLWSWGFGYFGQLGHNNTTNYSSPTQVGSGTDWNGAKYTYRAGRILGTAIKTDGTLWVWGANSKGSLGQNEGANAHKSSPTQIPGTTWSKIVPSQDVSYGIKTDGTLWTWGSNDDGKLGQNQPQNTHKSSPTQVPGTTWSNVDGGRYWTMATKTDGTLWIWGENGNGELGLNDAPQRSSPVQIPGTTWNLISAGDHRSMATKTDGTLWVWGDNNYGTLGLNQASPVKISSPTQIPGTEWTGDMGSTEAEAFVIMEDNTP